jgi:hypothetical protein
MSVVHLQIECGMLGYFKIESMRVSKRKILVDWY